MTNQPPLNPDAERQCVELLLEYHGTPMHRLYEYPHRDNDSDRYIADAKSLLKKILAVAQPEVNSVEELDKLPLESVVRDKYGYVYLLEDVDDEFKWSRNGLDAHFPSWGIVLPARVLYRPVVDDA